jgi:hypothetical protein
MKKTLFTAMLIISALFVMRNSVSAQNLYFCEGVTESGQPITQSTTFNIPSGGGYFYFLVKMPYAIGCTYVDYNIYTVDSRGNETYNTSINQSDIGTDWTWFWKKVTFNYAGYYRVEVLDCSGYPLVSNYVTVNYK